MALPLRTINETQSMNYNEVSNPSTFSSSLVPTARSYKMPTSPPAVAVGGDMSSNVSMLNNINDEIELLQFGLRLGITLGTGTYAKVKSAYSESLQHKVAIKIINRRKAPVDFQRHFLPRELEILQCLEHSNIIKVYNIFSYSSKLCIVMDLAKTDLLDYIKLFGRLTEDKARKMFAQLISAVDYLHSINIVHRDLKCENVLLDKNFDVKLSDFGFARILESNEYSSTYCGSAAYASCEILQGIPYKAIPADLWSCGVILYIMVYGSMPFDDSNMRKLVRYQIEKKIHFSHYKPVSNECKYLILLLLEPDIKLRGTIAQIKVSNWMRSQTLTIVPNSNHNKANRTMIIEQSRKNMSS